MISCFQSSPDSFCGPHPRALLLPLSLQPLCTTARPHPHPRSLLSTLACFHLASTQLFHGKSLCMNCFLCSNLLHPPSLANSSHLSGFILQFPSRDAVPDPLELVWPYLTPLLQTTLFSFNNTFIAIIKKITGAMFNDSSTCFMSTGTTHLVY